jgi:hypothetical protein
MYLFQNEIKFLRHKKGYLTLDPLLFVWDQYVISLDVPGYHDELIPIICAIILMLLRDQIMGSKSVTNLKYNILIFFKTKNILQVIRG